MTDMSLLQIAVETLVVFNSSASLLRNDLGRRISKINKLFTYSAIALQCCFVAGQFVGVTKICLPWQNPPWTTNT